MIGRSHSNEYDPVAKEPEYPIRIVVGKGGSSPLIKVGKC